MQPLHIFLLVLVVAIWGINFIFLKIGLQEFPPLLLCFCRFFLVGIPAVFFFRRPAVPFKWVILYSLVMFVIQFALLFSSLQKGISASLASLLLQTQVFFSLFFATLFLKENWNRMQLFGALLSFSGIVTVIINKEAGTTFLGLFLILAAAAAWGLGSVIVKKMGRVQSGSLLVWGSMIAWPPLLALSLFFEQSYPLLLQLHLLSFSSYISLLFVTLCATVIGFGIWNRMMQIYPVASVAPYTLLVPIFSLFGSVVFLDEPLESWKILAAVQVMGGLCVNLLSIRLSIPRNTTPSIE